MNPQIALAVGPGPQDLAFRRSAQAYEPDLDGEESADFKPDPPSGIGFVPGWVHFLGCIIGVGLFLYYRHWEFLVGALVFYGSWHRVRALYEGYREGLDHRIERREG
jgi:hypothetical protein